jgi:hypothetical protein
MCVCVCVCVCVINFLSAGSCRSVLGVREINASLANTLYISVKRCVYFGSKLLSEAVLKNLGGQKIRSVFHMFSLSTDHTIKILFLVRYVF